MPLVLYIVYSLWVPLVSGTHIVMIFLDVLHGSSMKLQLRNSDRRNSIEKGRVMLALFVGA